MSVPHLLGSWIPPRRSLLREWWGGHTPRRRLTSVAPYQIHSVEFGTGADELILLHGLSGSARWWSRNVPGLAERFRVIIPDLVGFGSSPAVGRVPRLDEMADVLASWMETLDLGTVHLAGHSMGGQVAVHFATRHPERLGRLVLVDAAGIPRPLTPGNVLRFGLEIAPLWRWGDPAFLPVIFGDAWTAGPRTLLHMIGHLLRDDVRPLLPRVQAPTLVIWGERDNWIPLEHAWEFRHSIPNSELTVLRSASHNPMVDRPEDFNRLVTRFLDGERVGS